MSDYRQCALEGASAVDLVVALYDGMVRFLSSAAAAVDRGDTETRRAAVKRTLDIIIHLQARLRMDVGGRPAQALSEFYTALFAQILQASQSASRAKFDHAINCVKSVREAWRLVARDPEAYRIGPGAGIPQSMNRSMDRSMERTAPDRPAMTRWTA